MQYINRYEPIPNFHKHKPNTKTKEERELDEYLSSAEAKELVREALKELAGTTDIPIKLV
tara:strand:+ start:28 stop:207 length:180 start_codon:yes stop_codon:yes gene_type:complete